MRSLKIVLILLALLLSGCSSPSTSKQEITLDNEPLVRNLAVSYSDDTPNFPTSVKDYRLEKEKGYDSIRIFS